MRANLGARFGSQFGRHIDRHLEVPVFEAFTLVGKSTKCWSRGSDGRTLSWRVIFARRPRRRSTDGATRYGPEPELELESSIAPLSLRMPACNVNGMQRIG